MKKFGIILLVAAFGLTACEATKNMSKQDKGVAIGATGGAIGGAVIGHAAGNTAAGAVIGGVIGGVAGGIIGHKMDKQAEEIKKIDDVQVEKVNNGEGLRVTFPAGILFETNKSELNSSSRDALTKFATSLQNNPETNLSIAGHTDNTGTDAINQPLSENRAASVANFLVGKGVNRSRMTTVGHAANEPVADNATADGRAKNRRVEIIILANEKMIKDAKEQAQH